MICLSVYSFSSVIPSVFFCTLSNQNTTALQKISQVWERRWKGFVHFRKHFRASLDICAFRGTFCIFRKIFCVFQKTFCEFRERFCVFQITKCAFQENIFYIIKKRFRVFQKTFCAFFRERFCALQKRFCVFQQIFCIFWETYFAPFGHRKKEDWLLLNFCLCLHD